MRKASAMICMLLALAMAAGWLVLGMPIARAQTFSQMKDSIPEKVTFTIDGEAVEVPVILPDVETLPIGYICPLIVEKEKMEAAFGDLLEMPVENGFLKLKSGDPFAQGGNIYLESGIAPLVEIPPERAGEKFMELMEQSGLPLEWQVDRILARGGSYEMKEVEVDLTGKEKEVELSNSEYFYPAFTTSVPDLTRPIAGKEGGAYFAYMTLMANGVPVYSAASPHGNGGMGPYASMLMWSENDYSFSMSYISQPCGAGEEPELVPFDTIVKAVQARIDEGWLRAVDSLELCYAQTARLVNGKRISGKDVNEQNPSGVLVPAWKVNGYDRLHLHDRRGSAFEDPTPFERYLKAQRQSYRITYDATTGELWNRTGWEDR